MDGILVINIYLVYFQWITIKETCVSWDYIPKFYADYVTWNKNSSIFLNPFSISKNLPTFYNRCIIQIYMYDFGCGSSCFDYLCFGSKTGHESSSSITSIIFLYEAYRWINQKKGNNPDKILPIRWFPLLPQKKIISPKKLFASEGNGWKTYMKGWETLLSSTFPPMEKKSSYLSAN